MGILVYNGQSIEQRDTDGMVCFTQMAKANGVEVSNWRQLDKAERYILGLERTLGIPRNDIFVSRPGSPENGGGSWGHYLLAIEFARWISEDFAIWCDQHIHRLVTTGSTSIGGSGVQALKDQIELACLALTSVYSGVVEPCRLALRKHQTVARISPVLAGYLEGAESMLPSAPPKDQTFTPTQIGKMLEPSISAQKVNKLLEEHGYQENQPTAKGKVHWVPTAAGKPHCVVTLDSKANGDPVESVRWKKSIVDELLEAIA